MCGTGRTLDWEKVQNPRPALKEAKPELFFFLSSKIVFDMAKRTSPEGESGEQPYRAFMCEYPGCGKRFQRKEHLNRHTLNRE